MKLRYWRDKHKLTQVKAAALLGMAERTYQETEAGNFKLGRRTELAMLYLELMLAETSDKALSLLRSHRKKWHENNS